MNKVTSGSDHNSNYYLNRCWLIGLIDPYSLVKFGSKYYILFQKEVLKLCNLVFGFQYVTQHQASKWSPGYDLETLST